MSSTSNDSGKVGFPMLDMMINMQRIGLRAMSAYQPLVSAFFNSPNAAEGETRSAFYDLMQGRPHSRQQSYEVNDQVIGVGEEVLNVGTRMIPGKTTRVHRVVVQTPVQQDVTLHSETVVVERRKPILSSGNDVLTEVTVEMSDFNEVPVISKSVHLVEEVLLRKEVTARIETIHETVRRDKLEIEQPTNLPVLYAAAEQKEKPPGERPSADKEDRNQLAVSSQTGPKAVDQKRP